MSTSVLSPPQATTAAAATGSGWDRWTTWGRRAGAVSPPTTAATTPPVKRQVSTSRIALAKEFFGFAAAEEEDDQEEEKQEVVVPVGGEGDGQAAQEVADVDELLWEAQLAFVNHRHEKAQQLLERAAERGSSDACLNLANLSLKRLTSTPLSHHHHHRTLSGHASYPPPSDPAADLSRGCRWLLRGLKLELAKPPPSANLETVDDLVQTLASLYRYGKLRPPRQLELDPSERRRADDFWSEGAAVAEEWIRRPVVALHLGPSSSASSSSPPQTPTGVHLDPQTRFQRSTFVHLCYLLALARFPFSSPPPPRSDPAVPLAPTRSDGSPSVHWGHAEAQRYWTDILAVSRLRGGVGTREGDAIVAKARRRIGLLHESEMYTPPALEEGHAGERSRTASVDVGPSLQLHQSPDSFEARAQPPAGLTMKLRMPSSRQKAVVVVSEEPSKAIHAESPAPDRRTGSPLPTTPTVATAPLAVNQLVPSPAVLKSTPASLTRSLPLLSDVAPSPASTSTLPLRVKPSRPRLRTALSRDIFLGDRSRSPHPASPFLSAPTSRSSTPTTFVSIEHAGLHDSKGKSPVDGAGASTHLGPGGGDARSTFSRRMRNDSFASLASLDVRSVRSFATSPTAFSPVTASGAGTGRAGTLRSRLGGLWRPAAGTTPGTWTGSGEEEGKAKAAARQQVLTQSLVRALQRDEDLRAGWTWEEIEAVQPDQGVLAEEEEDEDRTRVEDSPSTGQFSDSTSTVPNSGSTLATSAATLDSSPDIVVDARPAKRPSLPSQTSSARAGKLFVTLPQHRPLTAPGTPRASRERRALGKAPRAPSSPLAPGSARVNKGVKKQMSVASMASPEPGQGEEAGKGFKMDPLLAALEEKSRVNVKARCAVCGQTGINFPKCPRCDKTFCSRDCRVSSEGGGDGIRHMCQSREPSPQPPTPGSS